MDLFDHKIYAAPTRVTAQAVAAMPFDMADEGAAPRAKAPDAKPYRPLPAKDAGFVGNSVAADICRQRTRAERAFKRERLDAQKAQSKRDERRRRA